MEDDDDEEMEDESEISDIEQFSESDVPTGIDPLDYCIEIINELKKKEKVLTRMNQRLKKRSNSRK